MANHDPELRAAIIAEMKRERDKCQEALWSTHEYCTWWFKFAIPYETRAIRKELERMERDGLVAANRRLSNNTRWRLIEAAGGEAG